MNRACFQITSPKRQVSATASTKSEARWKPHGILSISLGPRVSGVIGPKRRITAAASCPANLLGQVLSWQFARKAPGKFFSTRKRESYFHPLRRRRKPILFCRRCRQFAPERPLTDCYRQSQNGIQRADSCPHNRACLSIAASQTAPRAGGFYGCAVSNDSPSNVIVEERR